MNESQALSAFAALSQDNRLRIVQRLVQAGAEGLPAGLIAEAVGASPSNISFHLKELERAGLVAARRESRSIVYRADYDKLSGLVRFLMEDCCAARPEVCRPIFEHPCCSPKASKAKRAK